MEDIIEIPKDIYYLVHITNKDYKNSNGKFLWKNLKTAPVDNGTDQFPGVYFSLITKDNLLTEELFPGKYCLIFSRNLLKQFNYHINVTDNNGYITEKNTFFPWSIKEAVKKIKKNSKKGEKETGINYHLMNEVIFHDKVPMKYCCIDFSKSNKNIWFRQTNRNRFLPDYPIENNIKPNISLCPFYCYAPTEKRNRLKSSLHFFQIFAIFCNVDPTLSKDEIIENIQKKIPFLYSNREKQKLMMIYKHFYKSKPLCKDKKYIKIKEDK